jgi:hypothetical protein
MESLFQMISDFSKFIMHFIFQQERRLSVINNREAIVQIKVC